jgi:type IV secretory pathway VirB4 component
MTIKKSISTRPQSPHKKGMEFIAVNSGTPIYFDPFEGDNQGHIALWAKTRSGKSVLAAWFIDRALAVGVKTTIIDQPPSFEASTFKDFVEKMGGGYVDFMGHGHSINMFDIPSIPTNFNEEQAKDLEQQSQINLLRVLRAMALGDIEDSSPLTKPIEALLQIILTNFWSDQKIKLRYERARNEGIGSQGWKNHPILQDFMEFCHPSMIGMLNPSEDDFEVLSYIHNQFTRWVKGPHAKVLNTPSTISMDDEPLLAIVMRVISNNDEGAVFGSLLYLVAMRRAIAASATIRGSLLFIDEAAISFQSKAIAEAAALAMANGLKARMRVLIASQEPGSIANSAGGEKIMDAVSYHLIGRIGTESLAAYEKYLGLPRDLAVMNAGDGFKPDKATNSSRWLLKFGDNFVPVVAYLPALLVDLTANNVDERISRREREAATQI